MLRYPILTKANNLIIGLGFLHFFFYSVCQNEIKIRIKPNTTYRKWNEFEDRKGTQNKKKKEIIWMTTETRIKLNGEWNRYDEKSFFGRRRNEIHLNEEKKMIYRLMCWIFFFVSFWEVFFYFVPSFFLLQFLRSSFWLHLTYVKSEPQYLWIFYYHYITVR